MKNSKAEIYLSKAPAAIAMLALSVPGMLSSAIHLVYNFTDTFFVGMMGDSDKLAALSLSLPVTWIVGSLVGILGAGAPSLISRLLGAGEGDKVKRGTATVFWLTLFTAFILAFFSLIFIDPILRLVGAGEELLSLTREYSSVILCGTVISAPTGVLQGFLRGEGRTKEACICSVSGALCNIVLDPLLIFPLGLTGAALATVCGSLCSLLAALLFIAKRRGNISLSIAQLKPSKELLSAVLPLGFAVSSADLIQSVSMLFVNVFMARYGSQMLAAVGLAVKIYSFAISLIAGFTGGAQPFFGFNFGAGNFERLRKGLWMSIIYASSLAALFSLVFAVFSKELISVFTLQPQVVEAGARLIRMFAVSTLFMGMEICLITLLTAVGKAKQALLLNVARELLIFLPGLILLDALWGMDGSMLARPITDLIFAVCTAAVSVPLIRSLKGSVCKTGKTAQLI